MKAITARLQRRWLEAEDIVCLELVRHDGGPLPGFSAGAHIDLHVRPGLTRQYSLYNGAGERHSSLVCKPSRRSSRRRLPARDWSWR